MSIRTSACRDAALLPETSDIYARVAVLEQMFLLGAKQPNNHSITMRNHTMNVHPIYGGVGFITSVNCAHGECKGRVSVPVMFSDSEYAGSNHKYQDESVKSALCKTCGRTTKVTSALETRAEAVPGKPVTPPSEEEDKSPPSGQEPPQPQAGEDETSDGERPGNAWD